MRQVHDLLTTRKPDFGARRGARQYRIDPARSRRRGRLAARLRQRCRAQSAASADRTQAMRAMLLAVVLLAACAAPAADTLHAGDTASPRTPLLPNKPGGDRRRPGNHSGRTRHRGHPRSRRQHAAPQYAGPLGEPAVAGHHRPADRTAGEAPAGCAGDRPAADRDAVLSGADQHQPAGRDRQPASRRWRPTG